MKTKEIFKHKLLIAFAVNTLILIISITILVFSISNIRETSKVDLEIQNLKQLNTRHQNYINEITNSVFKKTSTIKTLKLIIDIQEGLIHEQDMLIEKNGINPEPKKKINNITG